MMFYGFLKLTFVYKQFFKKKIVHIITFFVTINIKRDTHFISRGAQHQYFVL
jgi:hypothetical protein